MNWAETIAKTAAHLDAKGVPDAHVAAELLASRLLATGRGFLHSHLSEQVSEPRLDAIRRAIRRIVAGEPVQYVLGEWDFRSLKLKCDRRALVPRPETEELVTRALAWLKEARLERPVVVDVGTGTGAIILSIASEYAGDGVFIGTDVSEEALSLARENADSLSLSGRVKLLAMDGLDEFDEPEMFDMIVSNPPYVESAVCETLDPRVRDWEPRLALDGGADGLDFYRRYLADALNLLKTGGAAFFEIGDNQGEAVLSLMRDFGFAGAKVEKDFSGRDRYAIATI